MTWGAGVGSGVTQGSLVNKYKIIENSFCYNIKYLQRQYLKPVLTKNILQIIFSISEWWPAKSDIKDIRPGLVDNDVSEVQRLCLPGMSEVRPLCVQLYIPGETQDYGPGRKNNPSYCTL